MEKRSVNIITFFLAALLALTAPVYGASFDVGVSSEPLDISGGGFFLDTSLDVHLLNLDSEVRAGLRPTFSLGPLPLNMRLFVIDLYATLGFRLEDLHAYVGVGPGFIFDTDFDFSSWSLVSIVGLEDIRLSDNLRLYIQVKVRGEGFFISPGFGLVLTW